MSISEQARVRPAWLLYVAALSFLSCGGGSDGPGGADTAPESVATPDGGGDAGSFAEAISPDQRVVDVPLPEDVPDDVVDVAETKDVVETGDAPAEEVKLPANTLLPPPLVFEKFTVNLRTSATLGEVGQQFDLEVVAGRGAPGPDMKFGWDFDGGEATGGNPPDGGAQSVTFGKAGIYLVEVGATDGNGDKSSAGVLLRVVPAGLKALVGDVDGNGEVAQADCDAVDAHLDGTLLLTKDAFGRADVDLDGRLRMEDKILIQSAVEEGLDAPLYLWPSNGSLGRKVRLIHPALLDAAKNATLVFEGAEPLVPVRGLPGYATFVVPPAMDKAGSVKLTLLMDGQVTTEWDFEVLPLPKASAEPGAKVLKAMELLEKALVAYPDKMGVFLEVFKASPEQVATLQGMMEVARNSFVAHRQAFEEAFAQMEPEGRAAFEQIALANGLDEVLERLEALDSDEGGRGAPFAGNCSLSPAQAATLLGILCAALDIADLASKVAEINSIAADYLGWFDWWPLNTVPIVGQVINFLSALSNAISGLTDLIGLVAEFLPDIGDMKVEAVPASLDVGNTTQAKASVQILLGSKLCSAALGSLIGTLMDQVKELLTNKLGASIPLASTAFKQYDFDRDEMDTVTGLVYDAVSGIVGAVVDALGIEEALTSLAQSICEALGGDPWLPLSPDVLSAGCGGMANGAWTCVEACIGGVTISGNSQVCGMPRQAQTGVQCNGCSQANCAGCCDGVATCVGLGAQNNTKCGNGGASCAACQNPDTCVGGVCTCQSNCAAAGTKVCQNNNVYICAETCGYCGMGYECINGVCTCMPQCDGKECGDDGCGGSCGECEDLHTCTLGKCVCEPNCLPGGCGPDGCGGSCGECPGGQECVLGICVPVECQVDADCDDGNPCTTDQCPVGNCSHSPEDGGACNDGDLCTVMDQCVLGVCKGVSLKCDDGNECTLDSCIAGQCVHEKKNGVPCSDGDSCTENDTCSNGECVGIPIPGCVVKCVCGAPGVWIDPGLCNWEDKTKCTAWKSACGDATIPYEDGTMCCKYGCCLVLHCSGAPGN